MSGALLPMPPGDPDALESYASTLASAAERAGALASSTVRVTADIKANASWTGSAAEGYSAFTGSLARSVSGTVSRLNRIASAVRDYAGYLRTAQEKVAAYNKAVEAVSCLVPVKQPAALAALDGERMQAEAAVSAADFFGDIAAGDVTGSLTIQSVDLQQQVQLLDEQKRSELAPRGPEAGAAPPGWQQRAAAQAQGQAQLNAFFGWDGLPNDPHLPEDPSFDGNPGAGDDTPYIAQPY